MVQAQQETGTGKKAGRVNGLYGFLIGKIDQGVMVGYLRSKGLLGKLAEEGDPPEQMAVSLSAHLRETAPKGTEFVECDVCLGSSPAELLECPFCGDDGEEESTPLAGAKADGVAKPAASVQSEPAPSPAKVGVKNDEGQQEANMATTQKDGGKKSKKAAGKKAEAAPGKKPATNGAAHANGAAALATVPKAGKLTVETLNRAVADVEALKKATSLSSHALGAKLLEINTDELWKLRAKEDGTGQRYRGFDSFVHAELGFTPMTAYRLMDVARDFTPAEVAQFGTRKLNLVLSVAKEDQPKLKAKLVAGASKRDLEHEAKNIRDETGFKKPTGRKGTGSTRTKPAASSAKGKPAEKITIANIVGKKTVKLFQKPETMRGLDWKELKRAKNLGHLPFGRLEMENNVTMYFLVQQDANGELVLVTETHRDRDGAKE